MQNHFLDSLIAGEALLYFAVQDKYSMPSNFLCYAVPHNLLKTFVLVFFQALGMEIQPYHNVCCALTD
jgi:hypothetical protein